MPQFFLTISIFLQAGLLVGGMAYSEGAKGNSCYEIWKNYQTMAEEYSYRYNDAPLIFMTEEGTVYNCFDDDYDITKHKRILQLNLSAYLASIEHNKAESSVGSLCLVSLAKDNGDESYFAILPEKYNKISQEECTRRFSLSLHHYFGEKHE